MSFSNDIKNDITKIDSNRNEKQSELSAILKTTATYEKDILIITTENSSLARLLFKNFKELYDINIQIKIRKIQTLKKNALYTLLVKENVKKIIDDLGFDDMKIPNYLIDDEEQKKAYLRGLFLGSGSVNDPKKARYHLEFFVSNSTYANSISSLLNEFDMNSKVLKREKNYMVYIKESEKISDFLRMIKAYNAVMYYEDIRIYRDHKNMTNRLNNCEQANIEKTINTALKQIEDINLIEEKLALDLLDQKTKDVCEYRKKYPESSLLELSEIISIETGNNISKSGLNHRFRKIKALAEKLKQ